MDIGDAWGCCAASKCHIRAGFATVAAEREASRRAGILAQTRDGTSRPATRDQPELEIAEPSPDACKIHEKSKGVTGIARDATLAPSEVTMVTQPRLIPLLVVRETARAIDFYVKALGAREVARFVNRQKGTISHVDLELGNARFAVTEEAPRWKSHAPPSLGGSPVVLVLQVDDVDACFEAMCHAGAAVVFPLQEFCGERMARVRDPFGHLWVLSQRLEDLSIEEIQRRRDELAAKFASAGELTGCRLEDPTKVRQSQGPAQLPSAGRPTVQRDLGAR
jgi:PhnB protein